MIPKAIPKTAQNAPEWFERFVAFVRAQCGKGSLFLDRESGFADLWAMFRDTQLTAEQEAQMQRDLEGASPDDQEDAWSVLERNAALFGASSTRQKWQVAQRNGFAEFADWESLQPFRSVDEHACVYAVAVESGRRSFEPDLLRKSKGEVFRLAAIVNTARGEPRMETSFTVNDAGTATSLRDVRGHAIRWFGLPCFVLLLEYMFRGDVIFVGVGRALKLAISAFGLRRRLAESDIYFVARPALATPLTGQSLVAPAFAALLISLFRSSGQLDLWMKVFPRLTNAGFSGHMDRWREIPIDAVAAKLSLLEKSDYKIRWAFFARPEEKFSIRDTLDFKVRFCESVRVMMRHAMEVRKTFFTVNVVSLGLLAAGGLISGSVVRAYYPAPRVSSVAGIDSSIDADSFRDGVPLRVRSGRPISVSLDAGKSAGPIELMVRSSRIGDDGERKPVLVLAPGERPASSVRTAFASGTASFIYVSDDGSTRGDVLELGVLKASRLIAWYPLHLSVVQPGGEQ